MSRKLLELIAISGEFPQKDLYRIAGGKSYKESVVGTLKREGLIKTYYRDSLRGLRLTCRAKKMLVQNSPERFKTLLMGKTDTNHIKSDLPRRERLHRIAGAMVTMLNAGIAVFKDEKPDIFAPAPYGNIYTAPIDPAFYNSREIKEIGTVFVKIKGARSVGVLVTPRDILVVYNIGNALMKWDYRSEMRTKALMKTVLCRERLPCYSGEDIKGLILADSMELCADILAETGSKQHFLLDGNYDSFYYLTNDYKGERILSVLCDAALDNRLRAILMSDLKTVYQAINEEEALNNIMKFKETWGKTYPSCVKSWEENRDILSTFFAYPAEVRKIIYTTNIIEGLNRQFRSITKTKPSFTNDDSLRKMLYLASKKIVEHGTARCRNWDQVLNQLDIMFSEQKVG